MNDIGRQTAEVLAAHYPASDALLRRTAVIAERLAAVNPHMNLTALTSPKEMALLHVYDSLALLSACGFKGKRVVDVGCGGGFPSVPLAILFPEARFTAVDSIRKKIAVVEGVTAGLGLRNLEPRCARAETLPERYDYVVSRAVTATSEFVNWVWNRLERGQRGTLPNGILYLKGGDLAEELALTGKRWDVYDIARFFEEEFFETKKVVYTPKK